MEAPQSVGEQWAYRERGRLPLTKVTVAIVGQPSRSPKVKIRYEEDQYEGLIEWVPAGRLRCPWEGREAFLADEAKWDAINDETGGHPKFLFPIAETVFNALELDDICWLGERGYANIFHIANPAVFESGTGIDIASMKAKYRHEEVDGKLYFSPAALIEIAEAAARARPAQVMKHVREIELRAEMDRMLDEKPSFWRHNNRYETTMRMYGDELKYFRRWAGEESAGLSDQIYYLQNELEIVTSLLNEAVCSLRDEGRNVKAGLIRKKYLEQKKQVHAGTPIERNQMWIDTPPKRSD